jgi:acetyl-CoA carboxylase biotin carboxyl carrier protein
VKIEDIEKLAGIVQKYDLTVLDISDNETKIRLESIGRKTAERDLQAAAQKPSDKAAVPSVLEPDMDFNNIREIKSPMVGVFYAAPSPDSPPFAKVGSSIKKGDVLCIIEAMKLMNEIAAETDGQIVDICVSNGDVVEYGQTLFKVI